MNPRTISCPVLPGLAQLAERYTAFIIDLWGVIHDGAKPHPGAVDALDRMRSNGGVVCLLSNSPRRATEVRARLDEMGIGHDRYDCLVTSGELTLEALLQPTDPWHAALGQRYLHLGPAHGFGLLDALTRIRVHEARNADFVLCTGTDPGQGIGHYADALAECAGRRLPLLCANPDLVVDVGAQRAVCAGALARCYETLGGEVRYHGKPYWPAYRRCLQMLAGGARRVLAIGDALETDVAGANAAGIDVALVAGGLHRQELDIRWGETPSHGRLADLLAGTRHQPDFVLPCLTW